MKLLVSSCPSKLVWYTQILAIEIGVYHIEMITQEPLEIEFHYY